MIELIKKFRNDVVKARKFLDIPFNEDSFVVIIDETPLYLEMNSNTTIAKKGDENINVLNDGRDKYRISIILTEAGNGWKLPPYIIVKGLPGKTVEVDLNKLLCAKQKRVFISAQKEAWCVIIEF